MIKTVDKLTAEDQEKLFEFLSDRLTPHKRQLFEDKVQRRTNHIAVCTENLRENHNASALLRTADGFGVNKVFALETKHPFEIQPPISKRAEKWLSITQYDHGEDRRERMIEDIKGQGYELWAAMPAQDAVSLYDIPLDKPVCLIFGNEVHGITPELEKACDGRFTIPMKGYVESFNVSVSLGICLGVLDYRLKDIQRTLTDSEQLQLKIQWAMETLPGGASIVEHYLSENDIVV
ncbi:MAG: RNA methyltransferase [Schleiferiaceae bacterium]